MKIFLIRHGEKQHINSIKSIDKNNAPLTDLGIKQIELLAEFLNQKYPQFSNSDLIYSSPITRAAQTADILKNHLKIKEIKYFNELKEFSFTDNYSLPQSDRDNLNIKYMVDIDLICPVFKTSFRCLIKNVLNFFEKSSKENNEFLLVSTHGRLIRNVVYYLFPETRPSSDKILESKIYHGGLTILDYDGNKFKLDKFNFADYLDNHLTL